LNTDRFRLFYVFPSRLKLLALAVLGLLTSFSALSAQTDSTRQKPEATIRASQIDSLPLLKKSPSCCLMPHSPWKEAIGSALIPGLGQAMNHKYWKIAAYDAPALGLGALFFYKQYQYRRYVTAYNNSLWGLSHLSDPDLRNMSSDQLLTARNNCYQTEEYALFGIAAIYTANVVDAWLDAYTLKNGKRLRLFKEGHNPKKAAVYSTLIPGLGQAYNHKYWKIPLIYAAGISLGYLFHYEESRFELFTTAYHQSVAGQTSQIDPSIAGWDTGQLLEWKNYYNRYRDLCFIGCTAVYLLNILDATVDAHLWHFKQNMGDDLSFRVQPSCIPVMGSTLPAPALSLKLSFF